MHANNGHPQERNWYIQVDGQAYGPFDDKTLWAFMCEGRVTALSLISQSANADYRPISANPGLMNWLNQVPAPQTAQASTAQTSPAQTSSQPEGKISVFMIMAEIRSGRGMDLMRTLQGLGPVQRIGDTVWILQARVRANDLRDILSQPLGADDRLFILDSFANETAWFNLSLDMDQQIAALWDVKPS